VKKNQTVSGARIRVTIFLAFVVLALFIWVTMLADRLVAQTEPTPKRVSQIQAALKEHGYEPGRNWHETQEVCRKIADAHKWQINHAPDARVLILIGLGNDYSDYWVAQQQGNHLDQGQRREK
jgi:hypothetical protein